MIYIVFSYPDEGVIIEILSRSHKLADADPADNLDSCSGGETNKKIHRIM